MSFASISRTLILTAVFHLPTLPRAVAADVPPDIQSFISSWDKAWANHDPKALGMLHTEDPITVNRYGTFLRGRNEIQARLALLHTNGGPLSQVSFPAQQILSVRFIQPNVAIVQTDWQSPEIGADGKIRLYAVDKMILTYVLVKSGSEWKATQVDTHDVVKSMHR